MSTTGERQADLLQQILAAQAGQEARLEQFATGLAAAQSDAREARDTAKEIAVILREQNALERVAEFRAEARTLVADLRADVEHAFTPVRVDLKQLRLEVDALNALRTKGQGVALGGKWVFDILKVVVGAGGGAMLLKLIEAAK